MEMDDKKKEILALVCQALSTLKIAERKSDEIGEYELLKSIKASYVPLSSALYTHIVDKIINDGVDVLEHGIDNGGVLNDMD